jgi:hypothetical protein
MSEFGRGYATCLFQFANHAARLQRTLETYASSSMSESQAVEIWANGASDHLYDLVRPRRGVPRTEWRRAEHVAMRSLDIGHGFRASSKSSAAEARYLLGEARLLLAALAERGHAVGSLDECVATDRALGLRPELGMSCREDLAAWP